MRIVVVDNIYATEDDIFVGEEKHLINHGGYDNWTEFKASAERNGYSVARYLKGFSFDSNDIIYFCDRELTHFYKGWKLLKKAKVLNRTIAVLIESDVVDRKCGINILSKIKGCFPFFMTYQDDLIDNCKFFKIWPYICISENKRQMQIPFEEKKMGCLISTNQVFSETSGELYSERKRIVEWFDSNSQFAEEFHVFGKNWEIFSNYGGIPANKSEVYSQYKFAFCIENCRRDGYITEKIFDCFNERIVPIYLGAPNIREYIDENCFIEYSQFDNLQALVDKLSNMTQLNYDHIIESIECFISTEGNRFGIESQFDAINLIKSIVDKSDDEKIKIKFKDSLAIFKSVELYEIIHKIKGILFKMLHPLKSNMEIKGY